MDPSSINLTWLAILAGLVAMIIWMGIAIRYRPAVLYRLWLENEKEMQPTTIVCILWVSNAIFELLLLPSCCLAPVSVFYADARSVPEQIVGLAFISGMSLPLVIIFSLLLSRFLFKKHHQTLALIVSFAPLLNIGAFILANALMSPYLAQ